MTAKLLNFPTKEVLLDQIRERDEKSKSQESITNEKGFHKILSDPELAKEMFTPDYFLLVE